METHSTITEKMRSTLAALPPEGVEELSDYLDRLADKYQVDQTPKAVVLGGLWKETPFDIEEAEVRALRRRVTDALLTKD